MPSPAHSDYSHFHSPEASELVLLVLLVLVLVLGLVLRALPHLSQIADVPNSSAAGRQTFVLSAESCDESVVWPQPVAPQAVLRQITQIV